VKKIITVSREFGSGGRTIARQIAEKLNLAYYDKELVKQVATETGFHEDFVEQQGEYATSGNWFAYALSQRGGPLPNMLSADDFLWAIQRKVILEIAEKDEPCVIVGRCADYILRDRDDCLNIFIHAPMDARAERIVRLYGESDKPAEKRLEDKDKRRRLYYKRYTGRDWGISQNYHLSLDSQALGIENCVDIVSELFKKL